MRRFALPLAVPSIVALAVVASGCASAAHHPGAASVVSHRPADPLQEAGHAQNGFSYTLLDGRSCEVGDGIAIVADDGAAPVVIQQVTVSVAGASRAGVQTSYRLLTFRAGSTDGEIAASFHLGALNNVLSSQPAIGATLRPEASSKRWYDIVARLSLDRPQPAKWQITGLTVTYSSGGRHYFAELAQQIHLPAAPGCHPPR